MKPEDFINTVKQRFDFLVADYGFALESAEISKRFEKPMIIYNKDDLQITVVEGRGSIKVFARILGEIDLGFTFGEIIYFLDMEHLPQERVYGYGPDPDWDEDHESRLIEQIAWYGDFLRKQLSRVFELLHNDEKAVSLNRLVAEKRQRLSLL